MSHRDGDSVQILLLNVFMHFGSLLRDSTRAQMTNF